MLFQTADNRVARALNVDEGFSSALSDGDRSALADLVQDYFCSDPANHNSAKHAHSNENDFNVHGPIAIIATLVGNWKITS